MNKSLQGRFREVIYNNYTFYYFVYMYIVYTNMRLKSTHLGFSPTDVPATFHVKFWRGKQPIFVFICEGG
jgi:hypothetical protein